MRTVLMTLTALAITWSCAGVVRADVAPFPRPPETCTETKMEQPGTDCETCSSWLGDDDSAQSCADQFADTDYEYVCTTGDWQAEEVWCDGPPRTGGCSLAAAGAPSALALGVVAGLAALGVAVRRRS